MKKRVIAVLTAVLMTASLAGCGSGKLSNDYVTVNKYKGLEVTEVAKNEVSDDSVEQEVQSRLEAAATEQDVTDRAAQNGDWVNIDYTGTLDGVAFDRGTATGYDLEGVAKDAGGFIHLINSGAACLDASGVAKDENGNGVMKEWWNVTEEDQKAIMENTEWCMADNGYFRGGGYSSRYETKAQMPATMIRLNLVKGLGPVLQIAEGWTVALPAEVSDKLWKRTDYTWPCTWFAPRCDGKEGPFKTAYDVMNNWGANHGAISYGHIGADLITMCSMLRIPVSMHNVPEKDIYRPAAWNAFGMDKEGADFRACKNYGPLYK